MLNVFKRGKYVRLCPARALICMLCGAGPACYAAPTDAGNASFQSAANDGNQVDTESYVPLPSLAWTGANIVPQNANGLCVDGVVAAGDGVSLQNCSGTVLQRFKWQEGSLMLAGGRCLDLDTSAGTPKLGTAVQLQPCDPNRASQLWVYGGGMIFPEQIGRTSPPTLCLSTLNASALASASLALGACSGSPNALTWDLTSFDGNTVTGFPISSALNAGLCVDDASGLTTNGTRVQIYTCNGLAPQNFQLHQGVLSVGGAYVDITAASTADGTLVQIFQCIPADQSQNFTLEHGQIRPWQGSDASKCIELPGGNVTLKTQLDIISCSVASTLSSAPEMHWVVGLHQVASP